MADLTIGAIFAFGGYDWRVLDIKGGMAQFLGDAGSIGIQGSNILKGNVADGKCTGGIRPALWVKL